MTLALERADGRANFGDEVSASGGDRLADAWGD
jgi:hypothetical protein